MALYAGTAVSVMNGAMTSWGVAVAIGYLGTYATLGVLFIAAAVVFVGAFGANRLLRPSSPAEPND